MAFRQRESQSQVLFFNFNLLQYNFNLSDMKGFSHIEANVTATTTWPKWSTAAEVGTAVDDCFSPTYHVPSGTSRAKEWMPDQAVWQGLPEMTLRKGEQRVAR